MLGLRVFPDFTSLDSGFYGITTVFYWFEVRFLDLEAIFTEIRCSKHVFEGDIPVFRG